MAGKENENASQSTQVKKIVPTKGKKIVDFRSA